ncbi:MAG: preprotein translocase subunit SecG [Firmicutes bacterium]|nr:preprotein translocase subunit SecG [Bacillota bacterium]
MDVFETIVTVLEAIASLALIVVVLLQSGKESGLSGALTGSNNDSYLSKSKHGSLDKVMASATKWIALVWVLLTLSLSLF